jgi:hypothetical protein
VTSPKMENFYALVGPRLVDQGFSSVPVMPHTKRPGKVSMGQFHGDLDWPRFAERAPTGIEARIWSGASYAGAGVCVVLGYANVVAVDIDSDAHALVNDIEAVIGESPVGKIGRRGVTWFFRADPSAITARFKLPNGDGVDFLAKGAQTVVPGSIHPDTGRPYTWQGDSLETYTPERLPKLPADIADRIAEVMKRNGRVEPPKREPKDGSGVWAAEKAAAMDTREQWLPKLGFTLDRTGKRMNAAWRSSQDANVAVYPDGFYDHVENRSLSAIDVVMEMRKCSNGEAVEWLRPWIHIEEPEVIHYDFGKRERVEEPRANPAPGASGATSGATSRFALTWASDIVFNLDDEWLFKGLIPKVGVVSVYGDSRSFKTFLLIYLAVMGALGKDFAQHKCKNPGPIAYVAAENATGVEKRLVGFCMAHGIDLATLPVAIVSVAPNLGTVNGDAEPLAVAIHEALAAKGYEEPSAIIIDTLNQTLGDADENGAGMQAFMSNGTKVAVGSVPRC